ncbi:unknown [Prevotella sp. CAG:873]|nr:unknown [Prevotella sp. CAG:873]
MKKTLFYAAIIGLVVIVWLVLGCLLTLIFEGVSNFSYALGTWCGQPFMLLLAIGIALLFRTPIHGIIFKEAKQYKSKVALYIIGAAILWGVWMIGVKSFYRYAQAKALNEYQESVR